MPWSTLFLSVVLYIVDEHLVEAVRQILRVAHVVDGLPHRPEGRHGDEIGLHDAAGGVLGIFEASLDGRPLEGGKLGEDVGLVLLVQILDDVNCLVRVELLQRLGDRLVRHLLEHLVAHPFVELGERRGIEVAAERGYERFTLVRPQQLNEVGKVGFVEIDRKFAHGLGIVRIKCRFHRVQELGAKNPLLVAQRDVVCRVLHPALPIAKS